MVNQTMSDVLRLYMLLSSEARRELLRYLARLEGLEIQEQQKPAAEGASNTDGPQNSARPGVSSNSRVPAWDRPIVSVLAAAERQRTRSKADRNSDAGQSDGRVISAGLAALNRAKNQRVSLETVEQLFRDLPDDNTTLSAVRAMWPRVADAEPANPNPDQEEVPDAAMVDAAEIRGENDGDGESNGVHPAISSGLVLNDGDSRVTIVTTLSSMQTIRVNDPPALRELSTSIQEQLFSGDGPRLGGARTIYDGIENFLSEREGDYTALIRHARYRTSDGLLVFVRVPRNWSEIVESPRFRKRQRTD